VEGRKGVEELIHSDYVVHNILATEKYLERNSSSAITEIISDSEMQKLSSFTTAPGILAVASMRNTAHVNWDVPVICCLDGISDPGNLGTIIRTADWFGFHHFLLSEDCTDFYNPKSLSATMGSFTRCYFKYADLATELENKNAAACVLNGFAIADWKPEFPLYLVIGSESHGIRESLLPKLRDKITIPGYGGAESLNAAIAAGIVMEKLSRSLHR